VRPLSPRQFNRRRETVITRLANLGDLTVRDQGVNKGVRKLVFDLHAPGIEAVGRPNEAHFHYEEWSRLLDSGEWLRVRYNYNYLDLVRGGLLGYHFHPLSGTHDEPVPHMKCELPNGTGADRHYAAYEIEILDAHDRLEAVYARGEPIDDRGLQRID